MKSKRLLASLLTISLTASMLMLSGCGSEKPKEESGDTAGDKTEEKAEMDKEQYLNVLLGAEPKTLDQSKATDSYSSAVLANTMEALTRVEVDESGKDVIVPGGAESWETSDDGLTWKFKLRDMKWNDGKAVTVDDYIYGLTRTLDPEVGSTYAFLLYPIKNAEKFNSGEAKAEDLGIKKVDDKTIEFNLETPCSYFLDLTYFKVMQPQRKDIIEQHGETYGTEPDTMVYSGPFIITDWVHNNQIVLEKNPEYWDAENVKLEKVTMKIIKEESARMSELYNGSLDMGGVTKQEWIEKFDATGEYEVKKGYDGSATYTFFNQENKYFKNDKIRKAFIIAEDRAGSASSLFRNLAEPATAWCPPGIQIGGEEFRPKVNYNPVEELKKANPDPKALLVEGLKEEGLDPDPANMTITYLQSGTDARAKEFAEFSQQNYKNDLGVNVQVDYVEWPIFQERTKKLDFEIAGQAWIGDYNDPNTFFDMWMSTAGIVPTAWSSTEYDDLIKKAAQTTDQGERTKLFKEAEKILIEKDGVISPGVWRFKNTYVRKYVKGYMSPMWGTTDFKHTYTSGRK